MAKPKEPMYMTSGEYNRLIQIYTMLNKPAFYLGLKDSEDDTEYTEEIALIDGEELPDGHKDKKRYLIIRNAGKTFNEICKENGIEKEYLKEVRVYYREYYYTYRDMIVRMLVVKEAAA